MSKISCDIIKDLLPLYIDGVCSSDSIDVIEEHLKECPLCEAEFMNLQNNTDIKPDIDKDIDKAVKNANKKIKKGKKKAVAKALSITMAIIVIAGIFAYLIVPVKVSYHKYCDEGYLYSQCNLLDIEITNQTKPNINGKHADVYIDDDFGKYKITEIQDGNKIEFEDGKTLVISYIPTLKENVKPFYEEHGVFGIGGWYNFPFFNPIIKKGIENMGIDPDTLYADHTLYTKLLKSSEEDWAGYKTPLNPGKFAMWYAYYALYINVMPNPTNSTGYYIHTENDKLQGWGWSGYNEETGNRYVLQLQPKGKIYDNYNLIFTGFKREEMIEIVESVELN